MAPERILVLGAGELGFSIISALSIHPLYSTSKHQLSVLVRPSTLTSSDASKQSLVNRIRRDPISAEFETADVATASVQELADIFGRHDVIISCNGMGLPTRTQLKLCDAVLLAASRRTTTEKSLRYFPWQFGMDYDAIGTGSAQDLFDEQLAVRAKLRSQTIDTVARVNAVVDWTIITVGLFMSFLFRQDFGVIDIHNKTTRALGSWATKITVTTPQDIGRVVAEVVLDPPSGEVVKGVKEDRNGRIVYVAGDTVSYAQIAEGVYRRYGWKSAEANKEVWDGNTLAAQTKKAEGGEVVMVKYRSTFAKGKGVAWEKAGTFNATKGIDMVDLEQYLATLDEKGEHMQNRNCQ